MIASDDEDVPVAVGQSSDSESDAESPEPVAAAPLGSFGWEPLGAAVSPVSAPDSTPKKPVKLSEREVEAKERALAAGTAPASEAAFERALVARPSESLGWLQYAAWLLSLTEVAKARAVLRRGLKTMPVHLEAERSNLWLALLNLEAEYGDEESPHRKGLEMVFNQFKESLKKLGVETMDAAGKPFDPEKHNAVMHVEDENYGENTVVEVLQQGFTLGDKVLRFAIVKVAN